MDYRRRHVRNLGDHCGNLGTAGILLVPLETAFGWQDSTLSAAFGVRLALFGLLGPFSAALMNRFGLRRVVVSALVIILAGMIGCIFMQSTWQLFLFWGVLTGIGTGLTATILGATVATRWFAQRRGLVTGVLSASSATGQLIFLPALASITKTHGWQATLVVACVATGAAIVLVLLLMRDNPAAVGLAAYGETAAPAASAAPPPQPSLLSLLYSPIDVLKQCSTVPLFWVLFFTFFICGASTNGLIQTHFVPMCGDFGIMPVAAAGLLAMMGVCDLFGTIG